MLVFVIGVVMLVIFGAAFAEIAAKRGWQAGVPSLIGGVAITAVAWALAIYIVVVVRRLDASRLGGRIRRARLRLFADANVGVSTTSDLDDPPYPGIPFEVARNPVVVDAVKVERGGQLVEVGNLVTSGMSSGRQVSLVFGYVRVLLPQRLPHLVAVSTTDRGHSPIDVAFDASQMLRLEGDFDTHFTLYVPREYERDALYVVGPDLMARLIDYAPHFDVEIADDWLQFYGHAPFDLLAPSTYEQAIDLASIVGSKVVRQAGRYSDHRASPGDAVHGGRRLRWVSGMSILGATVGAGAVVLVVSLLLR